MYSDPAITDDDSRAAAEERDARYRADPYCTCGGNPDVACYLCDGGYAADLEVEEDEAEMEVVEERAAEELAAAIAEGEPWM